VQRHARPSGGQRAVVAFGAPGSDEACGYTRIRRFPHASSGRRQRPAAKDSPGQNIETAPENRCYDLVAQPYDPDEHSFVTTLRHWQYYFNDRYQTYGRSARFHVCYGAPIASTTPETRRADAAQHEADYDPFATIMRFVEGGYAYDYYDAMAARGAMAFPRTPPSLDMFQRHQPLMWAYDTLTEREAQNYASAVCQTIAPFPVSFGGNDNIGAPRTYGLIYTTDPRADKLRDLKDQVLPLLEECGVVPAEEATHPSTGYFADSQTTPEYAYEAMARFQREGITTILWVGGNETSFSNAAGQLNYRPEWVVASDRSNDGYYTARWQDKTVWQHAWNVTTLTVQGYHWRGTPCHDAYREVKPDVNDGERPGGALEMTYACAFYEQLRQLFTAVQVAGPKLTPQAVDKGFRAIPAHPSSSPRVPACFYEPDDWTCVKDSTAMWWDPAGVLDGESGVGCWRSADGGMRHLPWQWPDTDLLNLKHADTDPCNGEGRNLSTR